MNLDHRLHRCSQCGREWRDGDLKLSATMFSRDDKGNLALPKGWVGALMGLFGIVLILVEDAELFIAVGVLALTALLLYAIVFK